jgi:hypothetical protein
LSSIAEVPDGSALHLVAPLESIVAASASRAKKMSGGAKVEREFALTLEDDRRRGGLNAKLKRP